MTVQHVQLLQYLRDHDIIDAQLYQQLFEADYALIRDTLDDAGILTVSQTEKLMSLFSGYPVWEHRQLQPSDQYQQLPLPVSQRERVVVAMDTQGSECLLTDQVVLPASLHTYVPAAWTMYRAPAEQIDQYLDWYNKKTQQDLEQSIVNVSKKIRTIDSYAATDLHSLPQELRQEIAEDISSEKILKRLIALADAQSADQILLQSQQDSLLVRMRVDNETFDVCRLPLAVHTALYLKLRYLCDASLEHVQVREECTTSLLRNMETISGQNLVGVVFVPTLHNISILINTQVYGYENAYVDRLSLSKADSQSMMYLIRQNKGLLLVSGKSQSGKTFGYYQLLEAFAVRQSVASFEEATEYFLERVDQIVNNKNNILHDIRSAAASYQVLGMSSVEANTLVPLTNHAKTKTVVVQHQAGVADVLSSLLEQGLSKQALAQLPMHSLVSQRFDAINQATAKQISLSRSDVELLESYISVPELQELFAQNNIANAETMQWKTSKWLVPQDKNNNGPIWNVRSWLYGARDYKQKNSYVYLRGLVDLQPLVADAVRSGGTLVQLSQEISRQQKKHILESAIVRAAQGEISIYQILEMLRQ